MCIYNTPADNKKDFVELLDSFLKQISTERDPNIICGGINIDILSKDLLKSRYLIVIESNGFKILCNQLTRRTQALRTCISHMITQNTQCNVNALEQQSFSDHEALSVTSNVKEKASNVTYYKDYSFLKTTQLFERSLQILSNVLSEAQNCVEDIDDINIASSFQEKFLKVTQSFALYQESSKKTSKLHRLFNNRVKNFCSKRNKFLVDIGKVTNRIFFCKTSKILDRRQSEIKWAKKTRI